VHRRFRRVADEFDPPSLLLGETYVMELEQLLQYVVADGLQLCMNFAFMHTPFVAEKLAAVVARTESVLPAFATPVWHASSHDDQRFATRWCDGDLEAAKCALVALLSLRGTTLLYQGDEIAMEAPPVPRDRQRDMAGRDPCRTPMVWADVPGAGFTGESVEPWLPIGPTDRTVASQRNDPDSALVLTRDLIALRKQRRLLHGGYEAVDAPQGVWAFRRDGGAFVAINLGDAPARLPVDGTIVICTDRSRDEEAIDGTLDLRPREAVVVTTS
jgi:alpha-glucosidase